MTTVSTMIVSLAAGVGVGCSPSDGGSSGDACSAITGYKATTTTPVSFAAEIYPILSETTQTYSCGVAVACHGNPATPLNTLNPNDPNAKRLQFVFPAPDPAMARAQLLEASVNAPSMMRVVPNNVGQSFMAYKLSKDRTGLACVNMMCVAGASIGNNMPCGDIMPSLDADKFSDANRTKILDWIATGANP